MDPRRLIWIAIVSSTLIYLVIALALAGHPPGTYGGSLRQPVVLALYGAAVAVFFTALVVRSSSKQPPAAATIVALAMFEACAILGLVAAFVQHDWRLFLAPWLLSLIGFAREWPAAER